LEAFVADPEHQHRVHAPAGKTRMLFHFLCRQCAFHPDTSDKIERLAFAQFRGSGLNYTSHGQD
jgi:hypothetical protein